jgi:anti-sigma factor RsiW
MRAQGTNGARPSGSADRTLWQRSQKIEASPDEAGRFLDLAGFADHRLDDDDSERVAALLALDPIAAEDVAAARRLAGVELSAVDERVIARAAALAEEPNELALVIAIPPRRHRHAWREAASWSSLAAAIVLACWLGFDLGSGLPSALLPFAHSVGDASLSEFLDPSPPTFRDFGDGWRT